MFLRRVAPLLVFAVAAWPARAPADVIYDSFPCATANRSIPLGQFTVTQDLQAAYPVDVTADDSLASVRVLFRNDDSTNDATNPPGDWVVRFRADESGKPGAVLEEWTFANPGTPNVLIARKFDSVQSVPLQAGHRYWVNLRIVPGTGIGYWEACDMSMDTLDLWFANTGDELNPDWFAPANPYKLAVMTIETPEPGQALLLVTGAALLLGAARWRRRA